jgi:hypothetical protein
MQPVRVKSASAQSVLKATIATGTGLCTGEVLVNASSPVNYAFFQQNDINFLSRIISSFVFQKNISEASESR